jgi:hypothetical protein
LIAQIGDHLTTQSCWEFRLGILIIPSTNPLFEKGQEKMMKQRFPRALEKPRNSGCIEIVTQLLSNSAALSES